jgi:hypothetical protein
MAPTELVRRLTWEVVANRLHCQGGLHGEAANGLAKRRSLQCKEAL